MEPTDTQSASQPNASDVAEWVRLPPLRAAAYRGTAAREGG
jgi:hypothetical protein